MRIKDKLEPTLLSLLYYKNLQNLVGRALDLLGKECILW